MKATFVASLLYGVHCMDADIDTVVSWSNRTNRSLSSKASGPKDLQVSRLPACLRTRNVVTVAHIPPRPRGGQYPDFFVIGAMKVREKENAQPRRALVNR